MVRHARWRARKVMISFITVLATVATLAWGSTTAQTPAKTRIDNQIEATYLWNGEIRKTWSNVVSVYVRQVAAVEIQPASTGLPMEAGFHPGYDREVPLNQTVTLSFQLTNTGNATDTFTLTMDVMERDASQPPLVSYFRFYEDTNQDGRIDPKASPIDHVILDAGEKALLLLSVDPATSASDGNEVFLGIVAQSVSDPIEGTTTSWNRLVVTKERPNFSLAILPRGVLPEKGRPNVQRREEVIGGQRVRFPVTVFHTGSHSGHVLVRIHPPGLAGWDWQFHEADGETPLEAGQIPESVDFGMMAPGDVRDFWVEITAPEEEDKGGIGPYGFRLVAFFQEVPGLVDETFLQIDAIRTMPELWDPFILTVDQEGVLLPGTPLGYELMFRNASAVDVENVSIVLELDPYLSSPEIVEFQGLPIETNQYDPQSHTMTWKVPLVRANDAGRVLLRTQTREETPDGRIIRVRGFLTSETTTAVAVSNTVTHLVWAQALTIRLEADRSAVVLGDTNRYVVTLRNVSSSVAINDVRIRVDMPSGLTYMKGSSTQDGTPIDDPERLPSRLEYVVKEILPEQEVRVSFNTMVNVGARDALVVLAQAEIMSGGAQGTKTSFMTVHTLVEQGIFGDGGIIVGRVLLRESNATDKNISRGMSGVRVFLDDGRYVVSDEDGRFSFATVKPGTRSLRLEPGTLGDDQTGRPRAQRIIVPSFGIVSVDLYVTDQPKEWAP